VTFGSSPASLMTVPPQEWATSTVGPSCSASARRVAATDSASEVSGFCTAVTCRPAACRRGMTSAQLDPSAHAPCTSTTLRASVGVALCADAAAAKSVAATIAAATLATFPSVLISELRDLSVASECVARRDGLRPHARRIENPFTTL